MGINDHSGGSACALCGRKFTLRPGQKDTDLCPKCKAERDGMAAKAEFEKAILEKYQDR